MLRARHKQYGNWTRLRGTHVTYIDMTSEDASKTPCFTGKEVSNRCVPFVTTRQFGNDDEETIKNDISTRTFHFRLKQEDNWTLSYILLASKVSVDVDVLAVFKKS